MCSEAERTTALVFIETRDSIWEGTAEFDVCEGPKAEACTLEGLQFGILAAMRKVVKAAGSCNVTIMITNFRPRPLFHAVLKDKGLQEALDDNEEAFAWSHKRKQMTQGRE